MTTQYKKIILFIAWNVFWVFCVYSLWNTVLWFEILLDDFKVYKSFMRGFAFPCTIGAWFFGQIMYSFGLLKSKKMLENVHLGILVQTVIGIIPVLIWAGATIERKFGDVGDLFQKEYMLTAFDILQKIIRTPDLYLSKFMFLWFLWFICVVVIFYALKRAAIYNKEL